MNFSETKNFTGHEEETPGVEIKIENLPEARTWFFPEFGLLDDISWQDPLVINDKKFSGDLDFQRGAMMIMSGLEGASGKPIARVRVLNRFLSGLFHYLKGEERLFKSKTTEAGDGKVVIALKVEDLYGMRKTGGSQEITLRKDPNEQIEIEFVTQGEETFGGRRSWTPAVLEAIFSELLGLRVNITIADDDKPYAHYEGSKSGPGRINRKVSARIKNSGDLAAFGNCLRLFKPLLDALDNAAQEYRREMTRYELNARHGEPVEVNGEYLGELVAATVEAATKEFFSSGLSLGRLTHVNAIVETGTITPVIIVEEYRLFLGTNIPVPVEKVLPKRDIDIGEISLGSIKVSAPSGARNIEFLDGFGVPVSFYFFKWPEGDSSIMLHNVYFYHETFWRIKALSFGGDEGGRDACLPQEMLELTPDEVSFLRTSSPLERERLLSKAVRRILKRDKLHPDQHANLGLDAKESKRREQELKAINNAKDILSRGL